MQTFLPLADFEKSLRVLDYKRLGKQRVEAMQLHNVITGNTTKSGWVNHPAAKMWRGYADALALYHNLAIDIWIECGYNNTMKHINIGKLIYPDWFGNESFHASHRSNLLRKDKIFYW